MEKWNSKRAKELGVDADLLAAVNLAVKKGREQLSRAAETTGEHTIQFRKELENSGLKLYMFSSDAHPLTNIGHPGSGAVRELYERYRGRFSPELRELVNEQNFWFGPYPHGGDSGQLFILGASPEEVVDALAFSTQHNYPREILPAARDWMEDNHEDVTSRAGWLDCVTRRRAWLSTDINCLQGPSFDGLLNDKRLTREELVFLAQLRANAEHLIEEELQVGTTRWQIATLALTNRTAIQVHPNGSIWFEESEKNLIGGFSKENLAWNFVSSLLPHLQGDDQAKAQFQKSVSA